MTWCYTVRTVLIAHLLSIFNIEMLRWFDRYTSRFREKVHFAQNLHVDVLYIACLLSLETPFSDIKEKEWPAPTITVPEDSKSHTSPVANTLTVTTVSDSISLEELLSGLLRIPGHKRRYPCKYEQKEELRFASHSKEVPTDDMNYEASVYGIAIQEQNLDPPSEKQTNKQLPHLLSLGK